MCKFIKSASSQKDWIIDSKKEICFIGRSNVGKSTLINTLANKKIAKTSNTPGRTQLVNFFDFGQYRLVDLPGYGFAKVSKEQRKNLSIMLEEYLSNRSNLFAIFQICDINVITQDDIDVSNMLENIFGDNHFIILNKLDKQNKSFFDNNKKKISNYLEISEDKLIPISCKTKQNVSKLNNLIKDVISKKD